LGACPETCPDLVGVPTAAHFEQSFCRPGAIVCLGTDFQSHGDGHPGIEDRAYFDEFIAQNFKVVKTATNYVHREIALKIIRK
jgi:hypothetical protein